MLRAKKKENIQDIQDNVGEEGWTSLSVTSVTRMIEEDNT